MNTIRYTVTLRDSAGTTSPIDTVTAPAGYTADDYLRDCASNADSAWCEMLASGTVTLDPIED